MTPLSQFSQIGAPPKSNSGSAGGASSHQVAIDMSSTAPVTSPQTTRRLLPRIITKKTDNATVLLVGETRTPGKSSFNTAPSFPDPVPANFISSNWRTSAESNSNRNELSPSQIVSSASASGATVCTTATLNLKKTDSHTSNVHKDHGAFVQARSGGLGTTTIGMVAGTTHRDMLSSAPHSKLLQKQKEGKSLGRLSEGMSSGEVPSATPKKKVKSVVQLKNVPSYISAHYQNAPIRKLKHPLEENIFSSLFITLLAIAIALAVGVPLLCGLGVIVIGVVGIRYLIAIFHGLVAYLRFTCSSRQYAVNSRALPPHIFPRDRLAFANDIRWLGPKKRFQCQSILHTLLVFEGSMDVNTLRHLIQTRVLRAETPEGELAYPRLLQKLVSVTSGYIWELDLTFDIHNHIYPGPTHFTREQQLQQYMGRLLTQELPLTRPLWEIRVLPSYYGPGKDTMAILRVHQCLADGMSLIRILSHALADHQVMHVPQRPHFAGMSFGFNLLRSLIVGPLTIFLWWFTTFRDKNMFSVPLPKLHRMRRRSRRKWWQLWSWKSPLKWCRGQATVIVKSDGEEYEDKVSFTSSLDSGSSKWSSYESSGDGDTDSGSEHSCASEETGANKKYNLGLARAQGSPKEEIHTIIPKEGLPSQQTTPSHETTGAPSTLQHDPGMLATSSKSKKSNQVFDGVFAKSTKNFNKSLAKKLSTSRSSLQSQHDLTIGPGGKVLNDQSDKTSALLLSSTPGEKLKTKRKCNKKKRKKRKRRGGPHHHHRHHRKRKFLAGRKLSLASNSSGSSFASSSSSSRSTYSSCGLSRPPAWNVVWSAPMTLPKVARIKQIMRSSYNDVLLSAAAGSVRMYMQDQGIPYPGDVQVVIPVDLRNDIASPKQGIRLGCKVSSVLARIPSGIESAIPRLWATRHRLDELKASADSVVAYGATTILMNMLPHRIAIPILENIVNKASLQFCNLPGPTSTTVIGGYPLKGIYPIYPPPGRLRAAITVLTYADQVHITVLTHRSLVNAGPKLLKGMTEQVDQLSRQLSARRVPGESRRSTRNFHQASNPEITRPPTKQIQHQLQVVQEELAQLNSKLEAQGIILSDEEYGFLTGYGGALGQRILSGGTPNLSSQHQSGLQLQFDACRDTAQQYGHSHHYHQHHHHGHFQHVPHHHHHHHTTGVDSGNPSEEPLACTSSLSSVDMSAAGQMELQNRLQSLKIEFAQLIGELRRRSSIVEGIAMSFEDAENEEEYRKPRKRALSVVSMTRRSSIFSSRSNTAPESPMYSSEDELPSSPVGDVRQPTGQVVNSASSSSAGYPTPTPNIRHSSSPMRTTAV